MKTGNLKGIQGVLDGAEKALTKAEEEARRRKDRMEELAYQRETTLMAARERQTKPIAQLGGNATLENVLGKRAATDKVADSITSNGAAVAKVDTLLRRLTDEDIITGVAAKLSGIREKAASLFGNQGEINQDEINELVNGAVDPTDKNAVFLKDALYTAFDIERAAQGGRLTVQMMKQGGSALNPENYTKQGYASILGGRRSVIINNLRGQNLTDDDIKTLSEYFSKPQGSITTKGDAVTEDDIAATMKANNLSRAEVLKRLKAKGLAVPES
jgi:hypothetical protein